ncbi:MAG: MarR family transcriptional regulator [Nitrospiraceae bacterium]|nr:MarR family transcriptional regulator [Nitrospiraceae bacterium]
MGTKFKGSKEEIRALDVFIKLIRAADSVASRVESHLGNIELTVSQFGVLEALFHLGPLYQKDLARKILKSTGNITMVVDNLEKRGLVERIRDTEDRRHLSVRLTDKGTRLIRAFFPKHAGRIVREMSVLNASEQEQLGALCKRVGLQIGARASGRTTDRPS